MCSLFTGAMLSALAAAPSLACSPAVTGPVPAHIPPLAAALDRELLDARLSAAELDELKALRAEIANLMAQQKTAAAREVEERAMKLLGYRKMWLRCGPGTFAWMKLPPKPKALQPPTADTITPPVKAKAVSDL